MAGDRCNFESAFRGRGYHIGGSQIHENVICCTRLQVRGVVVADLNGIYFACDTGMRIDFGNFLDSEHFSPHGEAIPEKV